MNTSIIILSFVFLVLLISALTIIMTIKMKRTLELMDAQRKTNASMSYQREQYENRIQGETTRFITTYNRFKETKGLLLYTSSPEGEDDPVRNDSFFRSLGINLSSISITPKQIMCLIPFHKNYTKPYQSVQKVCKDNGFNLIRSDERFDPQNIMQYIVQSMLKSQYIIAFIDSNNPNVAFELGMARALGKSVVCVADVSKVRDVPFDMKTDYIVLYKGSNDLIEKLDKTLKSIMNNDKS